MQPLKTSRLRIFNNWLTAGVVGIALYILIAPLLPQFTWWIRHDSPARSVGPRSHQNMERTPAGHVPQESQLLIPRLDMQERVFGGDSKSLRKGIWHIPNTSTPNRGGNTVFAGHRFTYSGSGVFYHLDKVQKGDELTLYWEGKAYRYTVLGIKVVPPSDVSVEAPTSEPTLTVYTCTPLWSAKDRLVVQAKLTGGKP